ncbi:hypothetical protein [Roseibium aggregatum]|uniref:Uncharacterized protein n=1 Tax=Roseibium aggregatum TaxID=187304 RepID=A0A939EHV0_9HYPH|nr:hypothetical protein [Roseibium aggregatum]MBN9673472.1 hypothetical protein [Roseibium aggregatum]
MARSLKSEIEEARERVAQCRIRAERPQSRLEDEFALEKARNRLLTLELRLLKQGLGHMGARQQPRAEAFNGKRTKPEHLPRTARQRAEEAFAGLQAGAGSTWHVANKKGGA